MSRLPKIANPHRPPYPSDLSDAEWEILEPLLPKPKGFGHPRTVNVREILNAIFYVQRTGYQWEMLPHDFPPYQTAYNYFQKWQRKGIWQEIHDTLRRQLRRQMGREDDSSLAMRPSGAVAGGNIADSQSVKTTEKRGWSVVLTVVKKLRGVSAISS